MKDFVERSGFRNSQWEKVTHATNHRTVTRQKCRVIDDITAFHLIWDETLPRHILQDDTEYEIMDAREFMRSIDSSSALITRPRTPKSLKININPLEIGSVSQPNIPSC